MTYPAEPPAPAKASISTFIGRQRPPPRPNYQVFNHLLNAEGNLVAQIDGPPLPSEHRGTMDWDDPEETIYSREYALALLEDLAARRILYRSLAFIGATAGSACSPRPARIRFMSPR